MSKLKFAHLADLHLGAFREKKLTDLNFKTFQKAIEKIIEEKCEFVLFVGDIFNTPMPELNLVNQFVKEIRKLQLEKIPVYVIGGSHDYSNNHKSFIELLDTTRTLINVGKFKQVDKNKFQLFFTKNERLKICLTGIKGRRNNLEKNIYENLEKFELNKNYFNVFLFHSTLDDLKPKDINFESKITSKLLPTGFDYYAGGHIHKHTIGDFNGVPISYSGCLFPNNFKELKEEMPTFNLCEFDFESRKIKIEKQELKIYEKEFIEIKIENKNPIEAKNQIIDTINKFEINNKIKDKLILLKIFGSIDGKIIDIEINKIIQEIYEKGAFIVLKNTYKLKSNLIENIDVETSGSATEIEEKLIEENFENENDMKLVRKFLNKDFSKNEDEKIKEYEERIIKIVENQIE